MYLRPQKKKEHRMLTTQGFVELFESLDEVKKQGTSSINSKQFLVHPLASCSEITRPIDLSQYERRSILQDCEICGMMQTAFPTT